jgi:hypothetical protein
MGLADADDAVFALVDLFGVHLSLPAVTDTPRVNLFLFSFFLNINF